VSAPLPIQGASTAGSDEPSGLWGRAFRPFFLGGAVHAALVVLAWTGVWVAGMPPPSWLAPHWWHGHEMVFGVVAAAIAGFLLTAAPVWTGGRPLWGRPLAALFALWLAGRLALGLASWLPVWGVAAVDVAFLPAVAGVVARLVFAARQARNAGIVGIVVLLAAANAAVHAQALGWTSGTAPAALRLAVDAVVVLVLVIGGRITPAFTANALRRAGVEAPLRTRPWLDALAICGAAGLALAGLFVPRTPVTGGLALVAAAATAGRLAGWQTPRTLGDPLVWSLHLGMAWIALGLALVGLGDLGAPVPATAGLHALTAGAMGTMILAVMTRVGLGHTGRPLVLPRGAAWSHALVSLAALARIAAPFLPGEGQRLLLAAGGLGWAAAFALFALLYARILVSPRIDGRPG